MHPCTPVHAPTHPARPAQPPARSATYSSNFRVASSIEPRLRVRGRVRGSLSCAVVVVVVHLVLQEFTAALSPSIDRSMLQPPICIIMTSLPPTKFLVQYQLYADLDERLLICCQPKCGFTLSTARSQLTTHLRDKHGVSDALRQRSTHYLKHVHPYPFCDLDTALRRSNGSPVNPQL